MPKFLPVLGMTTDKMSVLQSLDLAARYRAKWFESVRRSDIFVNMIRPEDGIKAYTILASFLLNYGRRVSSPSHARLINA